MFALDDQSIYSSTADCLQWLSGLSSALPPSQKKRCHLYWRGPFGRKNALCIKSFLATQDMESMELCLWLDTRVALREHMRNPWLTPLLPYISVRPFDLRLEIAECGFDSSHAEIAGANGQRPHFARLLLLCKHGGMYFDSDTVFLRDLSVLLSEFPDDEFCYRFSTQPYANSAALRMRADGHTVRKLLYRAFRLQSARQKDLLRFEHLLDLDLLVLPPAIFDPLWLHHDKKDVYADAPYPRFQDFFQDIDSTNNAAIPKPAIVNFFPGAFSYHWHNYWDAPEHPGSWFQALEDEFANIVKEKYGLSRPSARPSARLTGPASGYPHVDKTSFCKEGFAGPIEFLTRSQCELIVAHTRSDRAPEPADWPKGRAVSDRFFFELATRPGILAVVNSILGDDVILWGIHITNRARDTEHPWHTDIESADDGGGFLTIWIGLENTNPESGIRLVPGSHGFRKSIQELAHDDKISRGEIRDDDVIAWAREHAKEARIVSPAQTDGDAVLFDGRMWHGSRTPGDQGDRVAMLLQYAGAGATIKMRERNCFEWPFRYSTMRPPVIQLSGRAVAGDNRYVAPPLPCGTGYESLVTSVTSLGHLLAEDRSTGWKPYHCFRGPTPAVELMSCHTSVLSAGHCPHPPHAHLEEEILVVLDGVAEIELADTPYKSTRRVKLAPGNGVYYPALQKHTIYNPSASPVTYLMLKWRAQMTETITPLGTVIFNYGGFQGGIGSRSRKISVLFEGPTAYLGRAQSHCTELQPDAGYAPHRDPYDVAIVLLEGTIETLGRTLTPHAVVYIAAGEPHGMHNPGTTAARYLVFEFEPSERMGPVAPGPSSLTASS